MKKETTNQTYKQIKVLGQGSYGKAILVECSLDKVRFFYIILYTYTYIILKSHIILYIFIYQIIKQVISSSKDNANRQFIRR